MWSAHTVSNPDDGRRQALYLCIISARHDPPLLPDWLNTLRYEHLGPADVIRSHGHQINDDLLRDRLQVSHDLDQLVRR